MLHTRTVCFLLVFAASLAAQQGRSSIQGTVTDQSGAAIPNATVTILSVATNTPFPTTTSDKGYYVAPALPVGTYTVMAERTGFKRAVRDGIVLQVDQRAEIDLILEVGSTGESITVTGEAPVTSTADATIGKVIENKRIQELPIKGSRQKTEFKAR